MRGLTLASMGVPLGGRLVYPFPASAGKEASDNVWATGPHWGNIHGGNDAPPKAKGVAGDPIYPMWPGIIVFAEAVSSRKPGTWGRDYGNRILVRHKKRHTHANGTTHWHDWFTFYAHLKSMRPKAGWEAKTDRMLGTMGTTGNSTNVHCHFALQLDPGWMVGVVDPHPYLEKARSL
jgi:murein DD-endopeptidase MepM/ murein hydrolase activator NlpD